MASILEPRDLLAAVVIPTLLRVGAPAPADAAAEADDDDDDRGEDDAARAWALEYARAEPPDAIADAIAGHPDGALLLPVLFAAP